MEVNSEMAKRNPSIHQSHINMAYRCQVQFVRRYGETYDVGPRNEVVPPGVAAVIGSAMHRSIELNLKAKLAKGEMIERDTAVEIAVEEASNKLAAGDVMYTDEEASNIDKTNGKIIDMSAACAGAHYDEHAPDIKPVALEERFETQIGDTGFNLGGIIDVREENRLRDSKTMGSYPAKDAAQSLQMQIYSIGHKVLHKKLPKSVVLDCVVKRKKPVAKRVTARPKKIWVERTLTRVSAFINWVNLLRSGTVAPQPADPMSWACSKKYCGYSKTCPYFSGRE